ncbi:MAG: hypothetical protein ABIR19_09880 [Ginsengibacter sp.]
MQNFQNKLYNYEANPPSDIWEKVSSELDSQESNLTIPVYRKKSRLLFYALTAAASLIIIFLSSLFFNRKANDVQIGSAATTIADSEFNSFPKDSLNNRTLALIIKKGRHNSSENINNQKNYFKKYLTVAGPDGQPVKISPKAAMLILSADNDYPPKPVWDKKINKWSEIMLSSTMSPTATNLLEIVQR